MYLDITGIIMIKIKKKNMIEIIKISEKKMYQMI